MFCRKCGAFLPEDSEFCQKCGTQLLVLDSSGEQQALPDKAKETSSYSNGLTDKPENNGTGVEAPITMPTIESVPIVPPVIQSTSAVKEKKSKTPLIIILSAISLTVAVIAFFVIRGIINSDDTYIASLKAFKPLASSGFDYTCQEVFEKYIDPCEWETISMDGYHLVQISGTVKGTDKPVSINFRMTENGDQFKIILEDVYYDKIKSPSSQDAQNFIGNWFSAYGEGYTDLSPFLDDTGGSGSAVPTNDTIAILGVDIDDLIYGEWNEIDAFAEKFLEEGELGSTWHNGNQTRGNHYGDLEFTTPDDPQDGRKILSMTLSDMSVVTLGGVSLNRSREELRALMGSIAQLETIDSSDHYNMPKYELIFFYDNNRPSKVTINTKGQADSTSTQNSGSGKYIGEDTYGSTLTLDPNGGFMMSINMLEGFVDVSGNCYSTADGYHCVSSYNSNVLKEFDLYRSGKSLIYYGEGVGTIFSGAVFNPEVKIEDITFRGKPLNDQISSPGSKGAYFNPEAFVLEGKTFDRPMSELRKRFGNASIDSNGNNGYKYNYILSGNYSLTFYTYEYDGIPYGIEIECLYGP